MPEGSGGSNMAMFSVKVTKKKAAAKEVAGALIPEAVKLTTEGQTNQAPRRGTRLTLPQQIRRGRVSRHPPVI
jgi:hypothetical protein